MGIRLPESDLDPPLFRREFQRVGQEIPENLLEPPGITHHPGYLGLEVKHQFDAFGLGGQMDAFHGGLDHTLKVNGLYVHVQFAGNDPGDIEQILHELGLNASIALDAFPAPPAGDPARPPPMRRL